MDVRQVATNSLVGTNKGKVSLEYGPIVYAVEEIDNKGTFDKIRVSPNDTFTVRKEEALLEGVNTLSSDGFTAIPYYAWSNRGVGKMKVWLETEE
jgi:hypothetical protein